MRFLCAGKVGYAAITDGGISFVIELATGSRDGGTRVLQIDEAGEVADKDASVNRFS